MTTSSRFLALAAGVAAAAAMNIAEPAHSQTAACTAVAQTGSDDARVAYFVELIERCRGWDTLNQIFDQADSDLSAPALLDVGRQLSGTQTLSAETRKAAALRFRQRAWSSLEDGSLSNAEAFADIALRMEPEATDESNTILAFVALRNGQAAYDAQDYRSAIALADEAAQMPDAAPAVTILRGWSNYQLGNYEDSSRIFASALSGPESEAAAEGLAFSIAEGGEAVQTWADGQGFPDSVTKRLRDAESGKAFARDHFLSAFTQAPKAWPKLDGIERGWVQTGILGRSTDGQDGLDQYRSYTPLLAYGNAKGRHRFSLLIEFPQIDIGTPSAAAALGLRPLVAAGSDRVRPTSELSGTQARFAYTREGTWQPFLEIGSTPSDGALSERLVGRLGLIRHLAKGGLWSVEGYSESRKDSLLAEAGLVDPITGQAFGRVIETGVIAKALLPIAKNWSAVGEVRAAEIDGENVADNDRISLGIGVSRNFELKGFEYFSLGLNGKVEKYDRNLDFYTFGNGGYFSPEDFKSLALILSFQTDELKDFVIRGTASVGYEDVDEGNGVAFPLGFADAVRRLADAGIGGPLNAVDSAAFSRTSRTGAAGSAGVEGVYRLNKRWALIGYAGFSKADNFTEYVGGLSLRYFFGERQAVVSGDIFPARLGFSQR